jgi:hypothetical protein
VKAQGYSTGTPANRNRGSFSYFGILALYVQVGLLWEAFWAFLLTFSLRLCSRNASELCAPHMRVLGCSFCGDSESRSRAAAPHPRTTVGALSHSSPG